MFIIKEKTNTVPMSMPVLAMPAAKKYVQSLINLWYKQLGYLGLRNVRKI